MTSSDRHESATLPESASAGEIIEVLPDLVFELTEDSRYLTFHAGPESELYVEPDEFLGKKFSEVLPGPVAEKFERGLEQSYADGQPKTFSYLLPGNDKLQYYECRLVPLESGHRLALIRNMTDTWREKTELEQSESRYRTLVNNIPGMVYRCHIREPWSAVYVSSTVEEMLGYSPEYFTDEGHELGSLIHPEDRQKVQREVERALEENRPFHVSYRMIDADDEVRYVTERGQEIYAEFDETRFLDGVVFDVTDVHQMRQRLVVNAKMAAVGNLAAGVAHEINNPLAIAIANLEYLTEEIDAVNDAIDDDPAVEGALADVEVAVGKVRDGIDRVHDIIEDLRAFTDAAESRADELDVRSLVDWAVQRYVRRNDCNGEIEQQLDDVSPVWASEVGIVQVVWNLLDNAFEALERTDDPGVVTVRLTGDDEHVRLRVSDDGPGMSREVEERAYEPFYTTKEVGQGAGLGLFVCQGLVDGMDGSIDLETSPGEGTTVQIELPAFDPTYGRGETEL